ncbi:hypothetical protein [Streptomyces sp. AC558_RSS880]|uniref:hypothetical protein n=1 Tax=Streptomyces sp. AC558_RSS880 TaxID=2823687 RepID=UPI001C2198D6|nr:hypothetical protein [Streptomyces sp. AC558_RSS880]
MAAADTLSAQVMPRRPGPVPPMPDRVDALLAEATVAGKVARLGSRWVGNCPGRVAEGGDGRAESLQVAPLEVAFAGVTGAFRRKRSPHMVSVTSPGCTAAAGDRGLPTELWVRIPCRPERSGRTVRQLARCAQVRLEPVASARVRVGAHADRTVFTGRDLTHVVGRVEAEGPVGAYPDELGAGLPYG